MKVFVDAYSIAERRRVKCVSGRRAREGFTQSKRVAGQETERFKSGDFSSERGSSETPFEEPESTSTSNDLESESSTDTEAEEAMIE